MLVPALVLVPLLLLLPRQAMAPTPPPMRAKPLEMATATPLAATLRRWQFLCKRQLHPLPSSRSGRWFCACSEVVLWLLWLCLWLRMAVFDTVLW